MKTRTWLTIATAVVMFCAMTPIAYTADAGKQIEDIKKRINREKAGLSKVERNEYSVLAALDGIDRELDRRHKQLKQIGSRLERILGDLQETEKRLVEASHSLENRKELFKKRAAALYKWQRGGSPFILLNGGLAVGELMRRTRYLELMLAEDRALVADLLSDAARQKKLKAELALRRDRLDRERMTLVRAREAMSRERDKKRVILANLRRERASRIQALKELKQAAERLQKVMDDLDSQTPAKSVRVLSREGLEALKGKLDYPVEGKVVAAFGITKHPEFSENLFRKGIDIEAPIGEEIRTVEQGKVLFADYFSGYGKMMIIDHGKRYYTVYAHLSELLKQPGDPVGKGEPIALVGDSGSLSGARLYFEIRKNGKPVDPLAWLKKR